MSSLYQRYDLIWEENGEQVGYKMVVECHVDLDVMPENVRHHIVRDSGVKYIVPRPALRKSLDLVWWEEEEDQWVGFTGIINSRVDPAKLPSELREIVKTHEEVRKLPHRIIDTTEVLNPSYARSSQRIGADVTTKSDPKATWKGLNGTFTSTFPATPSHYGGLNCSTTRHTVTRGPSFGTTPFFESRIT